MVTSILPVSNIINVTITNTPSGLTEKNVNSLGLFTHEIPSFIDDYRTYISASQVAEDFGTNSITAQMANAIFAQTPNIRTGNGRLVIIPLQSAVSATNGYTVTANISANLSNLIAVDDGDLRVSVNGINYDLTNIDLTNAATLADVAQIIQKKISFVDITATLTTLRFDSKKVGSTSTVDLAAVPGGTGTNLAAAGYLNEAAAVNTPGTNSSGETILAAIARTEGQVGYVPVITSLQLEDAAIEVISDGIQAQDRLFIHQWSSPEDIGGKIYDITLQGNTKTRCLDYTVSFAAANLMKAAYVGRGFSVNFNGSNTSQTMNLKSLATITPDTGINQTFYDLAKVKGADLYVNYDGVPSVLSSGGNDFFDNPYSDLALKFALETAGFNFLRQTNTKVPQTEIGMEGLKSALAAVLERFVRNGCIAPGSWTSSETFGDPETFHANILSTGYYIYSQPITQQSATEREERKAPLIQIAIKRVGAIHTVDIIVLVND